MSIVHWLLTIALLLLILSTPYFFEALKGEKDVGIVLPTVVENLKAAKVETFPKPKNNLQSTSESKTNSLSQLEGLSLHDVGLLHTGFKIGDKLKVRKGGVVLSSIAPCWGVGTSKVVGLAEGTIVTLDSYHGLTEGKISVKLDDGSVMRGNYKLFRLT